MLSKSPGSTLKHQLSANIDIQRSMLYIATANGHEEGVKTLVELSADICIEAKTGEGDPPPGGRISLSFEQPTDETRLDGIVSNRSCLVVQPVRCHS